MVQLCEKTVIHDVFHFSDASSHKHSSPIPPPPAPPAPEFPDPTSLPPPPWTPDAYEMPVKESSVHATRARYGRMGEGYYTGEVDSGIENPGYVNRESMTSYDGAPVDAATQPSFSTFRTNSTYSLDSINSFDSFD